MSSLRLPCVFGCRCVSQPPQPIDNYDVSGSTAAQGAAVVSVYPSYTDLYSWCRGCGNILRDIVKASEEFVGA